MSGVWFVAMQYSPRCSPWYHEAAWEEDSPPLALCQDVDTCCCCGHLGSYRGEAACSGPIHNRLPTAMVLEYVCLE